MNHEVIERRKRWVAALRSGEFKQGKSYLRTSKDEFCCLGVACEIYRRETSDGEWLEGIGNYEFKSKDSFDYRILPDDVANYFVVTYNPTTSNGFSLAELNDKGSPFCVIADVIEKEFIGE